MISGFIGVLVISHHPHQIAEVNCHCTFAYCNPCYYPRRSSRKGSTVRTIYVYSASCEVIPAEEQEGQGHI